MLETFNDSLNPLSFNQFRPGPNGYAAALFDSIAHVRGAANYEHYWVAVPDNRNSTLAARATFDTRVKLSDYSYIVAVSAFSAQAAGFKIQITDLGTGASLFSKPVQVANASGGSAAVSGVQNAMWFLPQPRLVLPPSELSIQLYNQATVANDVQIVLHLAQPAQGRPRP